MHFDHPQQHRASLSTVLLSALLVLAACAADAAGTTQATLPQVQLKVDTHEVLAEIADSDTARQTGLMNRANLNTDEGMLFVFARSEMQCMWMKNTLIDLDVAFADDSGRILNIEQMKAGTSDIHCSDGSAKFALEMNRNWFKDRKIAESGQIRIPATIKLNQP